VQREAAGAVTDGGAGTDETAAAVDSGGRLMIAEVVSMVVA
jgi:hypothetical protein